VKVNPVADKAIRYHLRHYVKRGSPLYEDLYNTAYVRILEMQAEGFDLGRRGATSYLNKALKGFIHSEYRKLTSTATLSNRRAKGTAPVPVYVDIDEYEEEPAEEERAFAGTLAREALARLSETKQSIVVGIAVEGKDEWTLAKELDLLPVKVADLYEEALRELRRHLGANE